MTGPSSELSDGRPVFGKPGKQPSRFVVVESRQSQGFESNPAATIRASAGESRSIPPGLDQGFVDPFRITMKLQFEINPLHPMAAAGMGTDRVIVVNVRRRHDSEATLAIDPVEAYDLFLGKRRWFRHQKTPGIGMAPFLRD